MKKQNSKTGKSIANTEPPLWLTAALRLAGDASAFENLDVGKTETSESFRDRCRQATARALAILKLRRERQRVGFLPVALTDYIQGLAKVAEVSLSQVLTSIGVEELNLRAPEHATSLGGLARAIGLSLRETLAHLRIDFAAQREFAPIALLVAHRHSGNPRRSQLDDCEAVLLQVESEYDSKSLRDLRAIEQSIRIAYQGGQDGPT
jgi:hypothetical protein